MSIRNSDGKEMNFDGMTKEQTLKKEKILSIASQQGITYGVASTFLVLGLSAVANYRSKRYRDLLSISAKVSIPVMTGLAVFTYKYEMTVYQARLHPERFNIYLEDEVVQQDKSIVKDPLKTTPIHHKILNGLYDYPFYTVSALGFPLAAVILQQQMQLKHLTLSQKIMHSRVYAQGGVLTILLVTMAFREYMDRRGRFPDYDREFEEQQKKQSAALLTSSH